MFTWTRAWAAMAALLLAAGAAALEPVGKVQIEFLSDPAGAAVDLDGELLCERTPCTAAVTPGRHEVRMARVRHRSLARAVELRPGEAVTFKLEPTGGRLDVTSAPSGVAVTVDGRPVGSTPIEGVEVDAGALTVAVVDRCWEGEPRTVQLAAGERKAVALVAQARTGTARVRARTRDGEGLDGAVFAGTRPVGETGTPLVLPVCTEELTVKSDHGAWTGKVLLEPGKTVVVEAVVDGTGAGVKPSPPKKAAGGTERATSGTERAPSSSERAASASSESTARAKEAAASKVPVQPSYQRSGGSDALSGAELGWTYYSGKVKGAPKGAEGHQLRASTEVSRIGFGWAAIMGLVDYRRGPMFKEASPTNELLLAGRAMVGGGALPSLWGSYGERRYGILGVKPYHLTQLELGGSVGLAAGDSVYLTLVPRWIREAGYGFRYDGLSVALRVTFDTGNSAFPGVFLEGRYLDREATYKSKHVSTYTRWEGGIGVMLGR